MAVREILLLGNPKLYEIASPVRHDELGGLMPVITDLHDTLIEVQRTHGMGRAIAAPQIGVTKRVIYLHIDQPTVFINPVIDNRSPEQIEAWDNCLSFPSLRIKVLRHKTCRITYHDLEWQEHTRNLVGDLSELLQHEFDHLNGILAVGRAIDGRSFDMRDRQPVAGV